jgi:16S rRNA (adenine1518-N6/adenine1519-N6)-dimethyltransferase
VAVEIDEALLAPLAEIVRDHGNVEVLRGDILTLDLATLFTSSGYLVVANIPYYLTSNLLRHLLETSVRPSRLALTVQKEVAERACAGPGDLSLLALSIQLYGAPRIAHHIPAGAFYPVPNVDSALLIVELYDRPELAADKIGPFFKVTKAAFAQKRKTLANSLAALPYWDKAAIENNLRAAGIDPQRRPQTLSMEEWGLLLEKSPLP